MALRKATTAASFSIPKLMINRIRCVSATPSASRFFNTDTQVTNLDSNDGSSAVDRRTDQSISRRRRRDIFSDVFDPFSPTRSLSQVLNLMDRFMETPFLSDGIGSTGRRGWDVKEYEDAVSIRIDMPGVGKDEVKVSVEGNNTLVIRGEMEKVKGDEENGEVTEGRRYLSRLELPQSVYKVDDIKAEMKNGVLKVMVPKLKEGENKNVFHVNVD